MDTITDKQMQTVINVCTNMLDITTESWERELCIRACIRAILWANNAK